MPKTPQRTFLGDGQTFDTALACSPETDDIAVIGLRKSQVSIIRNSTLTHIASTAGSTAGLAIDGRYLVRVDDEYVSIWDYLSNGR